MYDVKVKWGVLIKGFFYNENNAITISQYKVTSNKLHADMDGYRIVHLSDLHGKQFGDNQVDLVNVVRKLNPNLIVFTGDLIDSTRYGGDASIILMEQLVTLTPVYYVTGNHEWRSGKFEGLEKQLNNVGVHVLRNEKQLIRHGLGCFYLLGVDDPFKGRVNKGERDRERDKSVVGQEIKALVADIELSKAFAVLLSHRPELFPVYALYNIDLTFSGHVHGGQIRLPFIGGLFGPHQGILPKYSGGEYKLGNSTMILSRGLGNSSFPQRLFNRPEVVVTDLRSSR